MSVKMVKRHRPDAVWPVLLRMSSPMAIVQLAVGPDASVEWGVVWICAESVQCYYCSEFVHGTRIPEALKPVQNLSALLSCRLFGIVVQVDALAKAFVVVLRHRRHRPRSKRPARERCARRFDLTSHWTGVRRHRAECRSSRAIRAIGGYH